MKMPFGLHIGTEVTAPRHDGPSMTGRVVGRRTTGGRVWGVLVEYHDGLRDVVGVGFVRRVIPAPVPAAPTPPTHYAPAELAGFLAVPQAFLDDRAPRPRPRLVV